MHGKDPHQALKTTVLAKAQSAHADLVLVKQQWGREDVAFSVHAHPNSFSSSGIQPTDFLEVLGFERSPCVHLGECFVRWVAEGFDLTSFAQNFDQALAELREAERHLEPCGIVLRQSEGWGFYFGKPSQEVHRYYGMCGDGHTGSKVTSLKQTEDESFLFRFSWLDTGHEKGWITHYRPKHPPLSSEMRGVFSFLGFAEFDGCPEFEFEPCYWRSIEKRGDGIMFDPATDYAHRSFDAHAQEFSQGVEKLLAASTTVKASGLSFLGASSTFVAIEPTAVSVVSSSVRDARVDSDFDVAISFAGTERKYAEALAKFVRDAGFEVFYDNFYPEQLWGKNLIDLFDQIYRKQSRYCVIFVSNEYNDRIWTNHERKSAQARAIKEKGDEYILPIKVDEAELTGMPPTVGYLPIALGIKKIAELLVKKLSTTSRR